MIFKLAQKNSQKTLVDVKNSVDFEYDTHF